MADEKLPEFIHNMEDDEFYEIIRRDASVAHACTSPKTRKGTPMADEKLPEFIHSLPTNTFYEIVKKNRARPAPLRGNQVLHTFQRNPQLSTRSLPRDDRRAHAWRTRVPRQRHTQPQKGYLMTFVIRFMPSVWGVPFMLTTSEENKYLAVAVGPIHFVLGWGQ